MTDFALPLPAIKPIDAPDWLAGLRRMLAVRRRLARRRRYLGFAATGRYDWMLALPQSRHGG